VVSSLLGSGCRDAVVSASPVRFFDIGNWGFRNAGEYGAVFGPRLSTNSEIACILKSRLDMRTS